MGTAAAVAEPSERDYERAVRSREDVPFLAALGLKPWKPISLPWPYRLGECQYCGREFYRVWSGSGRYCSDSCAEASWRESRAISNAEMVKVRSAELTAPAPTVAARAVTSCSRHGAQPASSAPCVAAWPRIGSVGWRRTRIRPASIATQSGLKVNGQAVATQKMDRTIPLIPQWDGNFDVGADTGTPVAQADAEGGAAGDHGRGQAAAGTGPPQQQRRAVGGAAPAAVPGTPPEIIVATADINREESISMRSEPGQAGARAFVRSPAIGALPGLRYIAWIAGPGLLVMLADTDAGNVVTAAQAGAQWGYRLLPLILALIPMLYMVQELTVRLGIFTGRGDRHWPVGTCLLGCRLERPP